MTLSPEIDSNNNAVFFRSFGLISGLKIHIDKTELLEVGKQEQGAAAYYKHIDIKEVSEAKIFGVKISNENFANMNNEKYDPIWKNCIS